MEELWGSLDPVPTKTVRLKFALQHVHFLFTSSVIGHYQEALVVDAKGLPVQGSVSLQSLITDKLPPPPMPPIDD